MADIPETQKKIAISWALFIALFVSSNTATHWGTLFWYKQITLEERMDKRHARTEKRIETILEWMENLEDEEVTDDLKDALMKEELEDLLNEEE